MGRTAPTYKLVTWKITDLVRSPLNARIGIETDDATKALAGSIKEAGILQEPAVRDDGTIIYGTRRVYAASLAGLTEIPCKTYPRSLTRIQEHFLRIEENLQRKDLNAIEKARELQSFVAMQPGKGKQKAAAGMLQISETVLTRALGLLELPKVWQDLVANGTADPAHTRCLQAMAKIHEELPAELAQLYTSLQKTRPISMREWEAEATRYLYETAKPVSPEHSKKLLPIFAGHKAALDPRPLDGQLVTFNLALWNQLTAKARAETESTPAPPSPTPGEKLPPLERRRRIAMTWINRRLLSFFKRHPATALKWLPMLEISHPVRHEAIATARGQKDWSLEAVKVIPIVKKVGATSVPTFMADYLRACCDIALRSRLWFVKDFHQAIAIAAAVGLHYAAEFLDDVGEEEQAEIVKLYGKLPDGRRFPPGMDPKSLSIPKVTK